MKVLNEVEVDSAEAAAVASVEEAVEEVDAEAGAVAGVASVEEEVVAEVEATSPLKAHPNKYRNSQRSPTHVATNLSLKHSIKPKYLP